MTTATRDRRNIPTIVSDEYYVASANRQTFHHQHCEWAQFILNSFNLIEFASHEEAVEAGFKPCKTCRA